MSRLDTIVPWAPLGLSRDEAARHIGIGVSKFDEMVADGMMPRPKVIGRRRIWNRIALEAAFFDLPEDGGLNEIDEALKRAARGV